ncbi:endoribonuclease MazF [Acidisoma cellulosilytica]|uniref:mRNA interferase n=1 Tax=Acidisoma cellulosilyticum TaxID=2802395 RepID=A0A963Z2T7_9PROT|nr:endoribonuclease MazF [Acidisoma cellulosilyticum]MCB8881818.1 endoribonuclease MazF [Acidisoma cellulosilyticum]
MVTPVYTPARGDIVWLNFDPQAGHEQAGHRPALVLSSHRYNRLRGMMVCCPLTTRIKGYPFEVFVAGDPPSVVLADQIKNLDWRARQASLKGRASPQVLAEVETKIRALLGFEPIAP